MSNKTDVDRLTDRLEKDSQLLNLRSRDVLPERQDRPTTKIKVEQSRTINLNIR